jgi:hypothetical protein
VYNYELYLDFLIREKILYTNNRFIPGERCRGYCFTEPYNGRKLKRIEVKNYILKKNLRIRAIAWDEKRKDEMRGYSYLQKWWEKGKLKIDQEGAFKWIEHYREKKLKELGQKKRVKKRAEKIQTIHNTAENFKLLVYAINEGTKYYRFSGRGHRFYNPISNLKKELRDFLTYDGKPLADVDISNSQPFLFLMLLRPSFWRSIKVNGPGLLCLERLDKEMYDELRSRGVVDHIIILLKSLEVADNEENSVSKFTDLVVSGKFYQYIQEHFQPIYHERFDKKEKVKKEVLRILYLDPAENGDVFHLPCQTFEWHFPEVYRLFELIKSIEHSYFPIMLQRLESFLVLNVICKEISRSHPHIPLFTIHDNIITTKGNEGLVKAVMEQQIAKWTGYTPKVDSKDLEPVLLPQRVE